MEQRDLQNKLASPLTRSAAFILDYVVLMFIATVVVFVSLGADFPDEADEMKMNMMKAAIAIPGLLLCFAKDSVKGVSLGKWIAGIMVRNASDGEVPSFDKLFIRNLPLLVFPIEFFLMALNSDRKRFGDRIAGTTVLKNPTAPGAFTRMLILIIILVVLVLAFRHFAEVEASSKH